MKLNSIKYYTIIFLILFINKSIIADDIKTDSTASNPSLINLKHSDNLDSLLNEWYNANLLIPNEEDTAFIDIENLELKEFNDSIYIERLSKLPDCIELSYNKVVRNFIHLYTHQRRELVSKMLGLSDYYFPIFEEILDANDLPLELKYLPVIESALNPNAVSKAGATGIWQFIYSTGKIYKLEINTYVDERRDPVQSSYAAVKFLKDLYNIYDDWILAIAAYNCGPGNVNKAIRRSGGRTDFWEIYYRLPRETRGYVPAFIAASYVMNYYQEHDIYPVKAQLPYVCDTLIITEKLHLKQVSEVLNIPLDLLKNLNPQYRREIIPENKKGYALRIPAEYTMDFIDLEDSIFNYKDSILFSASIERENPSYVRYEYVHEAPKGNFEKLYYTVKSGDNIGYIAEWYHVGASKVRYWNNINRNLIRVGQKLIIYVPKNKAEKYRKINDMTFVAKQKSIGKIIVEKTEVKKSYNYPEGTEFITYKVKRGDTFWEIAKKFDGVTETDIMQLNNISNARNLSYGLILKIKPKK